MALTLAPPPFLFFCGQRRHIRQPKTAVLLHFNLTRGERNAGLEIHKIEVEQLAKASLSLADATANS